MKIIKTILKAAKTQNFVKQSLIGTKNIPTNQKILWKYSAESFKNQQAIDFIYFSG